MQAWIKYKSSYDKKTNASMLKKADYVCVLQLKADLQRNKIPFTEFWWIGPHVFEKVLPNNNYLLRNFGTNKMQVLHRTQLHQFTPQQSYLMCKSRRKIANVIQK